ncbi:MAG: PIG-L family deacetylase [Hyphomicrobiales bacterium]|jgi:LmbE family N-acetylglucosaminyl deacetylase
MPLTAPQRIADDRQTPRVLALWRALQPLKSIVRFMNTGAHPDDETSAMLAALIFRDGVNISYACANRGEGGQNDIGPEVTEDLGTVRTAEMERAAEVLDMPLYWLSETPDDLIFDFGFSKRGTETMEKWTRERVLGRFVDIIRMERPDIICPTFLDIPGQHGHHRAMTEAAHEVFDLAADVSFAGSGHAVWQVSKLYLPAWSGAGGAYDDEVPPPDATLTINGQGEEELSGWTWERIGQHSRWFHKTQGMGQWVRSGAERNWPLHLARSRVGENENAVTDNLPQTLGDLEGDGPMQAGLVSAQLAINDAIEAFPDRAAIVKAASAAHRALMKLDPPVDIRHHIFVKRAQLARVIRQASGADVRGWLDEDVLQPGQTTGLTLDVRQPEHGNLTIAMDMPLDWQCDGQSVTVSKFAAPSSPYPATYDPLDPPPPAIGVTVSGATSALRLETPPLVLPKVRADLSIDKGVINLAGGKRTFLLSLSESSGGEPSFDLPKDWTQNWSKREVTITAPDDLAADLYTLPLLLDGEPAKTVHRFDYPHIAPRLRAFPAELKLRAVHVELPKGRIGYVGAGNDTAANWLMAMGCDVVILDEEALALPSALEGIDSLLIGVFAIRFRPDLRSRMQAVHSWVAAGGNLVTLYHRPWDNWDPDSTPPARLEIGQPSLRWRVTDENAAVTYLAPDHILLNSPNVIGADDWQGWHKERGLYFAKSWDATYTPLLELADPGEEPHKGALLSAQIGSGRHTHCCLILHHQMEKLTPGAFRLMANLLNAT